MTDTNEIEALKAAVRGALSTAESLGAVKDKVEAIDARGDIPADDLEHLARVALAHALAAQALRGLIETMRTRRGTAVS